MALAAADIAAIKAYIGNDSPASDGLQSIAQLKKWTNPGTALASITAIDQDIYTNMINSAYVAYITYFSANFSRDSAQNLDIISQATLLIMRLWRDPKSDQKIREFFQNARRGIVMQMQITPTNVNLTQRDKNADSSSYTPQVYDYENKT